MFHIDGGRTVTNQGFRPHRLVFDSWYRLSPLVREPLRAAESFRKHREFAFLSTKGQEFVDSDMPIYITIIVIITTCLFVSR